jgi:hypothetical protein
VRALYAERTGDRKSVISDPTWLTRFKIHARIVERFRSGRVFLAGDAAHLHSPSGGQGITTGMQDAANLAWKLAHVLRRGADVSLLDTYDEERRPAAAAVLKTTDRNTRLLFADGALAKWFRNRVFLPLLDTKFVQRRLLGKLSQLGDGYRGSSLSRTLPRSWQRGIVAGDRVPDVVLAGGTTLFGMLAEGRVIALFGNPDDELAARLNRLGIRTGLLAGTTQRIFGSSPDVWLIRPDGYVVCRCALKQSGALAPVLRRLFARAAVDAAFGPAQSLPIPLRRVAFAAVCIQFLALMRTLGEIVRLRSTITLNGAMPYIGAALFTSAMAWIAVGLLFSGRMRATTFVAAATVAGLVVIKAATL